METIEMPKGGFPINDSAAASVVKTEEPGLANKEWFKSIQDVRDRMESDGVDELTATARINADKYYADKAKKSK